MTIVSNVLEIGARKWLLEEKQELERQLVLVNYLLKKTPHIPQMSDTQHNKLDDK